MITFTLPLVRVSRHSRREEGGTVRERAREHKSVMVREVLDALLPQKGDVVVDATFGCGGHSVALKKAAKIKLIALDADPSTGLGHAEPVIEANFGDLGKVIGKQKVNKILFDLGWNRPQLSSGRGFSFMYNEPLNMSYGATPRSGFTAAEALNLWSETTLADALFGYGDERYARRIAKAIVARRKIKPFETTFELVEVVHGSVPAAYRHGRINPATKTFQALRIAVNDELGCLKQGLIAAWEALSCEGRIAVITFHSIEDRIVKRYFSALAKGEDANLLYKKPLVPSAAEIKSNPASRSAKLRAIEKVCTQ